jgi:energy-coupling factor transporter ATP-binding protein EcfA2
MHDPIISIPAPVLDEALFSVRDLGYVYPDGNEALSHINLDIAATDRIALVGQNGSGKTTLVKHLCGLLLPSAGQVLYRNQPLSGQHLDRSRLEIGVLFQDPDDQLFGYTLLEDIAFGPRHQGLTQQAAEETARRALKRVSLLDKAYKEPHHLSFGQKKRAALAGLLAMQPRVLLLDEPTANLDPCQEQVFLDLLADYRGTLICISHDLIFLYELCQRAVVLHEGRIQHDYGMRDLVSQRQALRTHGLDFSFRLVMTASNCPAPAESRVDGSWRCGSLSKAGTDGLLVEMRDYHYRYPDGTHAICGIDLSIQAGERIAIVGENGAGKTTVLACLLGLRQGQGTFQFDGRPATRRLRKALWRQIGMVFQDCADQLFCPSVEEEIAFGLRQLGHSPAKCQAKVAQALSLVRLEGFEARVPLHLSGGERKRLALACVLAMEPKLLILDEPTAGLDPQAEELLLAILQDLPVTLLLVSHDMFFVKELTDRTLVMHEGRILKDLPTPAFLQDQHLANLNGLAYTFRQRCSAAISRLQHEHEYSHSHPHLHAQAQEKGPHHHIHPHTHHFAHSHPDGDKDHHHAPRRYHDHDHLEDN